MSFCRPIPNSLLDPERGVSCCLFVKDPQEDMEEVLGAHPVPGFDRIIGYRQLRTQFRDFKKRRELLAEHDAFFCDDRILPMLPKLIGSSFSRPRQNPAPVRLHRVPVGDKAKGSKAKEAGAGKALEAALSRARDATWIRFLGQGSTFSVRTAYPFHTPAQVAANVASVIQHTANAVPGGMANIQAIYLKSTTSVPLQLHASFKGLSGSVAVPRASEASSSEVFAAASAAALSPAASKPSKRARSRGKSPADAAVAAATSSASSASTSSSGSAGKKRGKAAPKDGLVGPAGGSASLHGPTTRISKGADVGGRAAVKAVREALGGKLRAKPSAKKSKAPGKRRTK